MTVLHHGQRSITSINSKCLNAAEEERLLARCQVLPCV